MRLAMTVLSMARTRTTIARNADAPLSRLGFAGGAFLCHLFASDYCERH
jgi:hypothetical protein